MKKQEEADMTLKNLDMKHPMRVVRRKELKSHRANVAAAQGRLREFISKLQQLPLHDGATTLSMDLFSIFERWCEIDLPMGFQTEFGRQINKACRDRLLPFRRKTVGRASLAAYDGLDRLLLAELFGKR